jgi:hypothetical protein
MRKVLRFFILNLLLSIVGALPSSSQLHVAGNYVMRSHIARVFFVSTKLLKLIKAILFAMHKSYFSIVAVSQGHRIPHQKTWANLLKYLLFICHSLLWRRLQQLRQFALLVSGFLAKILSRQQRLPLRPLD